MATLQPPAPSRSAPQSNRPRGLAAAGAPLELAVDLLDADLVSRGMRRLARSIHGLVETRLARAEARLLARVETIVANRIEGLYRELATTAKPPRGPDDGACETANAKCAPIVRTSSQGRR